MTRFQHIKDKNPYIFIDKLKLRELNLKIAKSESKVIKAILIILIISIIPSLLSLLLLRKFKRRWQGRLRRIRSMTFEQQMGRVVRLHDESELEEVHSYFIGDLSCRYNARSPYIRCAVNPCGPCEGCSDYQSKH